MDEEICIICKEQTSESSVAVREKGKKTLSRFSKLRKDGELEKVLNERTIVKAHATYRRDFGNERRSSTTESPQKKKRKLHSEVNFPLNVW